MDEYTTEQAVRREAIHRRLQGESRDEICRDLERSTSWFDKWWQAYRADPQIDFTEQSRAPHTSPQASAESGASRSLNPAQADHLIRAMPITDQQHPAVPV
jgi:transposase-like protein